MEDSICFSNSNNSSNDANNGRNDNNNDDENINAERKNIAKRYNFFNDTFDGRDDAWVRAEPMFGTVRLLTMMMLGV